MADTTGKSRLRPIVLLAFTSSETKKKHLQPYLSDMAENFLRIVKALPDRVFHLPVFFYIINSLFLWQGKFKMCIRDSYAGNRGWTDPPGSGRLHYGQYRLRGYEKNEIKPWLVKEMCIRDRLHSLQAWHLWTRQDSPVSLHLRFQDCYAWQIPEYPPAKSPRND